MFPTEIGTKKIPRNAQYPYYVEGDRGGGRPGEQGAGGVRETGGERAGDGISTMAGSGREIQKGSQRNEPNNVS